MLESDREGIQVEARGMQVVFEILPTMHASGFEPTPKESLLRMQQKCDDQELNLYDMCTTLLKKFNIYLHGTSSST